MGPVRSTRSRRKISPSKSDDVNKENSVKENAATGRVLRSGKHCRVDALVQRRNCKDDKTQTNGKNQTDTTETIQTTKPKVSGGDTTPRPLGQRSRFVMTSTPNTTNIDPPDITLSTPQLKSVQLPCHTRDNAVVFPRQYVARPKDRGPPLVDKKRRKVGTKRAKRSVTGTNDENYDHNYLPKTRRTVRETADFFGLVEVSSNSPSPPPPLADIHRIKNPVVVRKGSENAAKGRKNKIKKDENCEEFNRWINEFNNELDEAENFELRIA